ncbi:6340_t:CDS:1, partial [Scutellospora calospora]
MSYSVEQKVQLAAEAARLQQLLNDQEKELEQWKEIYQKLLEKLGNIKNDIADAVKESLPEILNESLKGVNIGDDIKQTIIDEAEKIIKKIDENPNYIDLTEEINNIKA